MNIEDLSIYHKYILYQVLMSVGIQPYIAIISDNNELLNIFIDEITKRISKVRKLCDYSYKGEYTTPEYLTKILVENHDIFILMNFDKVINEKVEFYLTENRKVSHDDAVYYQLIGFREYLRNASLIIPCSHRLTRGFFTDAQLGSFVQLYNLDDTSLFNEYVDEEKIKKIVRRLEYIDYDQRNKEIKKHLW